MITSSNSVRTNITGMTVQISLLFKNTPAHLCGKDVLADGDPSPEVRVLADCVPLPTDPCYAAQFSCRQVGEDGEEAPAFTIT